MRPERDHATAHFVDSSPFSRRFLLIRIAEEWGITVSFHPKPLEGEWNGAGCHTKYARVPACLPRPAR